LGTALWDARRGRAAKGELGNG